MRSLPCKRPCCAVVVRQRIANRVIRNRLTVVAGHQVGPIRVSVTVLHDGRRLASVLVRFYLTEIEACVIDIFIF